MSNIDEEVGLDISHHKGTAYTLDGPTDETMNKYEIHKSQRKLELPTDIEEEVAEKTSANGVPSSEADFNAFVNAVKNKKSLLCNALIFVTLPRPSLISMRSFSVPNWDVF